MKIVEIQYNQRKDEANVITDENYALTLTVDSIAEYNLSVGKELDNEQITEIMYFDMTHKAKKYAFKYVSMRLRTEKEIRDYIRQKGYDELVQDNVIEILKAYDYVDDEAYARAFLKDRLNIKKHGKERIKFELRIKGVSDEIIGRVIKLGSKIELENAVSIMRKRLSNNPDYKEKKKITNYLASKGYSKAIIDEAFYLYLENV